MTLQLDEATRLKLIHEEPRNEFERSRRDELELLAKTFCEASGRYKWSDTHGRLRDWYLVGADAIMELEIMRNRRALVR